MQKNYTVIIYYKYVSIEDPHKLIEEQRALCNRLGIKGRILIAKEGINGTAEGTDEAIQEYERVFKSDSRFSDVHIKKSVGTGESFPRLVVKARKEIVTLGLSENEDVNPAITRGEYLEPDELNEWIKSNKDFTIIDMRNDYEHRIGHFAGSYLPKMEHFRDLPNLIPDLKKFENKTVVTVCTSGVRCEKASGLLVKKGFKKVYQLHGGISTYMEKFKNDDFKGKLYVFDNRMALTFTPDDKRTVVGRCVRCRIPSESYVNCAKNECHKQIICCEACFTTDGKGYCGDMCEK